jgi:hypothetical protein
LRKIIKGSKIPTNLSSKVMKKIADAKNAPSE